MAIELFTGLPGAGKTAHTVDRILKAVAEGREVFVSNLNGISVPGVTVWDDPRQWEQLPPGALLVVDEAQRFWRSTRSADVPPEVLAMETHRHLGIDFLLTTQQPTYLLKHLRGLIGKHTHHLRRTKKSAQTWTWTQCVEDVESVNERERGDAGVYLYNTAVFKYYTSTQLDTHKPKIPRKLVFIASVFGLLAAGYFYLSDAFAPAEAGEADPTAAAVSAEPSQRGGRDRAPLTTGEYWERMLPRMQTAPWSAPLYDDRKVQAEPRIFCMSSAPGRDATGEYTPASVSCITEQGTPYKLPDNLARMLARQGEVYNPFKRPDNERRNRVDSRAGNAVAVGHGDALPAITLQADQVGAYGDIAVGEDG